MINPYKKRRVIKNPYKINNKYGEAWWSKITKDISADLRKQYVNKGNKIKKNNLIISKGTKLKKENGKFVNPYKKKKNYKNLPNWSEIHLKKKNELKKYNDYTKRAKFLNQKLKDDLLKKQQKEFHSWSKNFNRPKYNIKNDIPYLNLMKKRQFLADVKKSYSYRKLAPGVKKSLYFKLIKDPMFGTKKLINLQRKLKQRYEPIVSLRKKTIKGLTKFQGVVRGRRYRKYKK